MNVENKLRTINQADVNWFLEASDKLQENYLVSVIAFMGQYKERDLAIGKIFSDDNYAQFTVYFPATVKSLTIRRERGSTAEQVHNFLYTNHDWFDTWFARADKEEKAKLVAKVFYGKFPGRAVESVKYIDDHDDLGYVVYQVDGEKRVIMLTKGNYHDQLWTHLQAPEQDDKSKFLNLSRLKRALREAEFRFYESLGYLCIPLGAELLKVKVREEEQEYILHYVLATGGIDGDYIVYNFSQLLNNMQLKVEGKL